MPESVGQAVDTMNSPARSEILRALLHHPPLTRTELEAKLAGKQGVRGSMIRNHLLAMEQEGTVTCDVPREQRHGRVARWTTTPERVQAVINTVHAYLLGDEIKSD